MNNENEPLLKEKKEELVFVNDSDVTPVKEEPEEKTNTDENIVKEKVEKEEIMDKKENVSKTKEDSSKKELLTTIIVGAVVLLLLGKTIINFYYGFKYKDYVPEDKTVEVNQ